ncbi:beta-lactamase [Chitinispirillum alkaliphilum]|nr:beta-lactamase [Chitinispirillum alkaliphilum]
MNIRQVVDKIDCSFRGQVQKDQNVKNAYLLVHSEKLGVSLNLAKGKTGDVTANIHQPNHLASVGKLFTATIIGMLHERGDLSFDDRISKHLDNDLMDGLHVYKGTDYSDEIKVYHLLQQSSGLDDVFFPLLKMRISDPQFRISTRDAVLWGKNNLHPKFKPGKRHLYTDTNYYLLGLIIENITQKPFQKVVHELIFNPLEMKHAYMNDYSKPEEPSKYPAAAAFIDGVDFTGLEGIASIDHAGASVVAPLDEYLVFMKALVQNKILKEETLKRMLSDDLPMGGAAPGLSYGYSIWKFKTIPILMPEKYNCWGCVGVTGAFMFYHPKTESIIVGTFNHDSYKQKALRFMLSKVIHPMLKCK